MGYRSDVAYTIRFDKVHARVQFHAFLHDAKESPDTKKAFNADDNLTIDESNCTLNFYASDVKWYEDYDDVKCHTALLNLADKYIEEPITIFDSKLNQEVKTITLGYIFTRIGETSDDIEELCNGEYDWDWIHVSRSIVCDWL